MAYNRWLAHHQIKGAHWGVHNGPPYPLDRSKSNGHKLLKGSGAPQGKKKNRASENSVRRRASKQGRSDVTDIESAKKKLAELGVDKAGRDEFELWAQEIPEKERSKWMRDMIDETATKAKKEKLDRADKEGEYELDFLEYVQNEDFYEDYDHKRMLKEYSEYLDDRDAYAQKSLPKELLTPDNKRAMTNGRPLTEAVRNRTAEDLEAIAEAQKYDDQQHRRILNGANFLAKSKTLAFKVSRFNSATENGIPVKKNETSKEYDLKAINPGGKSTTLSGTNNCLLCTVAYDMRRRGYNVIARQRAPIELLYDIGDEDLTNMYKNTKTVKDESLKGITDKLKRQKNSRGSLSCSWKGKQSGHVVAYEVNNGKVTLYDAQDGTRYDRPEDLFEDAHNFTAVRLDNATPDYRLIKLAVE